MSALQIWCAVLLLGTASGLLLLPGWWAARSPRPLWLWLHGLLGVLALLGLLLLFERDWPQAGLRLASVVLCALTGLVLFSNRLKAQRFPRRVLMLHGLAAIVAIAALLAAP